MTSSSLAGRVVTGQGAAAGFTALDWVRAAFVQTCGIEPWPGTLNLVLDSPADRAGWNALQAAGGHRVPGQQGGCDAWVYPVRVDGCLPAAIVRPAVAAYPPDQLELVAAVALRDTLRLADGSRVRVEPLPAPAVRAAIFDVDGTLVNSVDAYHIAAGLAAAPFGWPVTRAMVREALNSQRGFWDLVIPPERAGEPGLVGQLRDATLRHWPGVLAEHVGVFPGLDQTLLALREAGVRLAIYTGSTGESFAPLERSGLLELFEVVLTARDVSRPKPDPEGILACLDRLGVEPAQSAYIGDSAPDIGAGRAAGVLSVGMLTGAGDSALLTAAGADWLLADHRGLLRLVAGRAADTAEPPDRQNGQSAGSISKH